MSIIAFALAAALSASAPPPAPERGNTVVCVDNTSQNVVLVAGKNRPIKVVGWVGNQVQFSRHNAYRLDREIFTAPPNSTCFKGEKPQ